MSNRYDWMNKPIRKVAIIGGSPSRTQAPFADMSWDIWAFSNRRFRMSRVTRWFEIHAKKAMQRDFRKTKTRRSFQEHWAFLQRATCPVYMQKSHRAIPTSVRHPLSAAVERFGRCFTSSASYLVALAIMEQYEGIGLWGVDLTIPHHFVHQHQALGYLLSIARQEGIHVYLPNTSRIVIPAEPRFVPTRYLYGYDWNAPNAWWNKRRRKRRRRCAVLRYAARRRSRSSLRKANKRRSRTRRKRRSL